MRVNPEYESKRELTSAEVVFAQRDVPADVPSILPNPQLQPTAASGDTETVASGRRG